MNHSPYTDWIFEDSKEISDQQSRDLRDHLEACECCHALEASLRSLDLELRKAEFKEPQVGFVSRWQTRFENNRKRAQRRQIVITMVLVVGGFLLLMSYGLAAAWPLFRSPGLVVWAWVYQIFAFYSYLNTVHDLIYPLLNQGARAIPLVVWIFSLGLLSQLAVLWIVSYRMLTNPRRVLL